MKPKCIWVCAAEIADFERGTAFRNKTTVCYDQDWFRSQNGRCPEYADGCRPVKYVADNQSDPDRCSAREDE